MTKQYVGCNLWKFWTDDGVEFLLNEDEIDEIQGGLVEKNEKLSEENEKILEKLEEMELKIISLELEILEFLDKK